MNGRIPLINLKTFLLLSAGLALFSCAAGQGPITQFGGPNRNGIYPGTGLLDSWPEDGPELAGCFTGMGEGYGSPAVTVNGIYIAGMLDTTGYVFHFGHDTRLRWKTRVGEEFHFKYVGSRGTPTVEGDRVYYAASSGEAVCLNAVTGEKIWHVSLRDRYRLQEAKWGYSESPLIYGDKVFFTPGGPGHNFVALDKLSGELVWAAEIDSAKNSYCSPVVIHHRNKDLVLLNSSDYILVIDPGNGDILVKHPLTHWQKNHALPPVYNDGRLFYASGYGEGATLFQMLEGKTELDTIYSNEELDPIISGLILFEGIVFGASHRKKQWVGVDYKTGRTVFTSRDLKPGSLILADSKLYLYSEMGEAALALPSKSGFDIVSRFQIPAGKASYTFAHPVIHDGLMYIRYNNDVWAYKVK